MEALGIRTSDHESERSRTDTAASIPVLPIDDKFSAMDGFVAEFITGGNTFKPLYLLTEINEQGNKTKHVTIAVTLPSAISKGWFTLHILDRRVTLQISVF